jgi:hypothetical protein
MNGTGRSARPVLFLSETTLTHSFELEGEDGLSLQHYEYLDRRHPDRLEDDDAAARLLCMSARDTERWNLLMAAQD